MPAASPNLAFGKNLRLLTERYGTITGTARELDISRVQFGRYLSGESFPKPSMLKRICDFFGVDARIYTDHFSIDQLADIRWETKLDKSAKAFGPLIEALSFMNPAPSIIAPGASIPDGLYEFYRWSPTLGGRVSYKPLLFKTLNNCKVIRGYDHRVLTRLIGQRESSAEREFRGVVLNQKGGFVGLFIHSSPLDLVTLSYFSPDLNVGVNAFSGLTVMCRPEEPDAPRLSRSYMQHYVVENAASLLKLARKDPLPLPKDVPPYIVQQISRPVA